jgi:hypothetical protein
MSSLKEKRFKFEEEDLDWINPLISEWAEENEGKKKSDLITELLRDYKQKREAQAISEERARKLKENVDKIKNPIDNSLNTVSTKFDSAMDKFGKKTDSLDLDAKIDRTGERINESLSKAATGLNRFLSRSTDKIKEVANKNKKSDE